MLPKVRDANDHLRAHELDVFPQVDGGIALDTIELAAKAGANAFVAGTAIYGAGDPRRAVEDLRTAAQRAATVA